MFSFLPDTKGTVLEIGGFHPTAMIYKLCIGGKKILKPLVVFLKVISHLADCLS